jgi:hypothetical protein
LNSGDQTDGGKIAAVNYFSDVPKKKFLLCQTPETNIFKSFLLHYVDKKPDTTESESSPPSLRSKYKRQNTDN